MGALTANATAPLNSLTGSNSVSVGSLGFSTHPIGSSANNDDYSTFFSICLPFVYYSCLMALTRPFGVREVSVARAGPLVLFLILEEKLSICHRMYDVAWGFATYGLLLR